MLSVDGSCGRPETGAEFHDPGPRRAFRSRYPIAVGVISMVFVAGISLGYAVQGLSVADAVLCWLVGSAASCFVFRILLSGIFVRSGGLVVRGWFSTHRIAWANVAGFSQPSAGPFNSSVYLAVKLTDGSLVKTPGLTAAHEDSTFAQVVLGELEEQWAIAKQTRPQQ